MERTLWILKLGYRGQELVCDKDAHTPALSPLGEAVAYLCRSSGTTQLWITNPDGSKKQQLTDIDAGNNAFVIKKQFSLDHSPIIWTHDGQHIMFARSGLDDDVAQLWSVPITGGEATQLVELQNNACSFIGWQDDNELLISSGPCIYLVSSRSGACRLFIEEQHCLSAVDRSGTSWLARIDGDKLKIGVVVNGRWQESCQLDYQPYNDRPLAIQPDTGRLFLLRRSGTLQTLIQVDLSSGKTHIISKVGEVVAAEANNCRLLSISKTGPFWVPISTPYHPAELYAYSDPVRELVSEFNPVVEELALPSVSAITWQSDGWTIEGLLVTPAKASAPYLTLVFLHSGPEKAVEQSFECLNSPRAGTAAALFASEGFAVLLVNFRGSTGYGKEFMSQLGDYHLFDRPMQDIIAGLEMLTAKGIVDPKAIGIYGKSYGAMLTILAIGHSEIFRGALAAFGYYDLELQAKYAGQPFHTLRDTRRGNIDPEEVWKQPELWQLVSPIEHAQKIRTPVLLIETSAERRPGMEAQPLLNILKTNNVESYLKYYPDAFHGGGWNDEYKRSYMQQAIDWFQHTLMGKDLPERFYKHGI